MPKGPRSVVEHDADLSEALTPESWLAQDACAFCGGRPNRNPSTGVWVRSWDAATRTYVEGHRFDCQRPREK